MKAYAFLGKRELGPDRYFCAAARSVGELCTAFILRSTVPGSVVLKAQTVGSEVNCRPMLNEKFYKSSFTVVKE